MRIVLCYPIELPHYEQICAAAPQAEVFDAGQQRIAQELFHADIFCGHAKVPVDWDGVVKQGRLKWIQSSAAGMDHCLVPAVCKSDILVTSASGVLANQVAEHTTALLFAHLRSLPVFFEAQRKREFIRRPTRDLHHSTVGIIGLGGVGRRVAEVLAPYKTRIIATDLFPFDKPPHVAELWPADQLNDLLAESDVVILCVPLNEANRGMIRREHFERMKRTALFINVARGQLVPETDLVYALENKLIAGAAMDVTEQEPLSVDSKLWNMPNVIITPHVGGQSFRRADDMTDFFCENLRRYQAGQPLNNVVDKELGFPVRKPNGAKTK
jgi:D-3-phosphoglycerate dehydrogenase